MGNTALKEKFGFEGERMESDLYKTLVLELQSVLRDAAHPQGRFVSCVPAYADKPSHGDIDLVMFDGGRMSPDEMFTFIKDKTGAQFVKKNSCVYSFDFKGKYQIDLAVLNTFREYENYLAFTSYSPVGNVLGRMVKQVGLKWGLDGLTYPVKLSDSEYLGDIVIAPQYAAHETFTKLISFFGSDKSYGEFQSQKDIFEFLAGSRLFNNEIFQFDNLNHINRKRDAKRPDYHAWLDFIADRPTVFVGDENKTVYIPEIERHFSTSIYSEWEGLLKEHVFRRELSSKFSGADVLRLTQLEGKNLGNVITAYKQHVGGGWDDFLMVNTKAQLEDSFLRWYNSRPHENN